MAKEPLKLQAYLDVPVCQVNLVNEKTVNRLKPQVEQIDGASRVFKALADDTRLKIVYALAETELCVCDVAELIGGSKATASYHLRLLHHLGMAKYRKEGKLVYYRLTDPRIGDLVREVLKHTDQTQRR